MIRNNGKCIKVLVCVSIAVALIVTVVSAQPPMPQNDVIVDVTPESQTGKPGDTLTYDVNLTNNGNVDDIIVVDSITGVPPGWTVELKDAGVPQTLPYQTPLLASQTSYLLTLDVHIPVNATIGATMTLNIHSLGNVSVTDTDSFACLVNNAPILSSGAVNPATGNLSTTFTYSVNYTDADNDPPGFINVVIDGTPHAMNRRAGQDGDYTNGEIYEYTITGAILGIGSHTFQFNASDGIDYAAGDIAVHPGPIILETDLSNVELISADMTITGVSVFSLNLSEINETYKPAGVIPQYAYMISSTGAGNFTLRFTDIPNANLITVYKINTTNQWLPLDTSTTTTNAITFTMDVGDYAVVFGSTVFVELYTGWNMISLPLRPDNLSASSVLATIPNAGGIAYLWNASKGAYDAIYGNMELAPGRAYWVSVTGDGIWTPTGSEMHGTKVNLTPGWNMIGVPSAANVSVTDITVTVGADTYTPVEAVQNGYIGGIFYSWNTANKEWDATIISDTATLKPGTGYFINVNQECQCAITYP